VRLTTAPDGRAATLRVHDGGRGVAGSERQRLFERFYRGRRAAERTGGAGLGLTIARQLAEEQGGSLELEADSAGTCFVLRLPAGLSASAASPADASSVAQTPRNVTNR
jgi:signal transduction histidine kinase